METAETSFSCNLNRSSAEDLNGSGSSPRYYRDDLLAKKASSDFKVIPVILCNNQKKSDRPQKGFSAKGNSNESRLIPFTNHFKGENSSEGKIQKTINCLPLLKEKKKYLENCEGIKLKLLRNETILKEEVSAMLEPVHSRLDLAIHLLREKEELYEDLIDVLIYVNRKDQITDFVYSVDSCKVTHLRLYGALMGIVDRFFYSEARSIINAFELTRIVNSPHRLIESTAVDMMTSSFFQGDLTMLIEKIRSGTCQITACNHPFSQKHSENCRPLKSFGSFQGFVEEVLSTLDAKTQKEFFQSKELTDTAQNYVKAYEEGKSTAVTALLEAFCIPSVFSPLQLWVRGKLPGAHCSPFAILYGEQTTCYFSTKILSEIEVCYQFPFQIIKEVGKKSASERDNHICVVNGLLEWTLGQYKYNIDGEWRKNPNWYGEIKILQFNLTEQCEGETLNKLCAIYHTSADQADTEYGRGMWTEIDC